MESGATGDIAICVLRRQGLIGIPIWLWLNAAWVDVAAITGAQFSTYVNVRLTFEGNPNTYPGNFDGLRTPDKIDGLTISKVQF